MVSKAYKLAILSLFAMISLFVYSSNDVVSANSVESNMNNEVSNVIQKNIQVIKHMNGTVEVYVKNKNEVANKLVEDGYSYTQVDTVLVQINNYFEENKDEFVPSYSVLRKGSGTCSKALQFIGYIHSGAYAVAGALLGITGPAVVIAPILIGLVYQAGSLFC
ncbi:hypothetical protein [Ligilactobacillus murinus]|uniref:Uncharacterized protein n=1 Tax=Ligilactobacillus murinus TaxID=1622 RepID=A0AAE7BP96_9LACO|nr:hypothetical protein [Ligilactobacillus murinus]NEF83164.1 hypothetical protein [Ligilactobacillus murinus]NEF84960.1 hypothetical protein [Ligilactobacillus murinus]NEF87717.1 hypothetical protein [Ligilactobacillus murinus]NEF90013.1 hypothetical protein [Ligilactobacillus murinus]NEF92285.1 hypothetical protein [Ligilactobacillus murinus]